jgi:phenylacetate-CoA ligase
MEWAAVIPASRRGGGMDLESTNAAPGAPGITTLPGSRTEIQEIQRKRKRVAFERAKTAPWYEGKLDDVRAERLEDRAEWEKIPVLDKDSLRQLDHASFMHQFCVAPRGDIAEYWRSGGTTGKPVFYPRTYDDVYYALISWGRSFPCTGVTSDDLCHLAFPIGIHPAGQVWARSAQACKVGMTWVGAGNVVPPAAQLELMQALRPTILMAMSSFALHLANVAEARGVDLGSLGLRKIICSAETLSEAKRANLQRRWGAEVFDVFGMSEAGLMGAETSAHDGIHIWTDLYYVEVIDPSTGRQVPAGEVGTLCVTPLWTNHATPFLRWNSGDLVSVIPESRGKGAFAELFPMIRHANRTTGFFKVRGINVNHAELEDTVFALDSIIDFQGVLETEEKGSLEQLRMRIELKRGASAQDTVAALANVVRHRFGVNPVVEIVDLGTLGAEFEKSVKAMRFVDRRV